MKKNIPFRVFRDFLVMGCCAILLLTSGCKDKNNCSPGSGGEVTLTLKPEHHGDPIYSQMGYLDSAFIAYGESEFPGDDPSLYDAIAVGVAGSNEVIIPGLKCGKYYVFMTGFDTSIVKRVIGGIPITINVSSGAVTEVIPVTED